MKSTLTLLGKVFTFIFITCCLSLGNVDPSSAHQDFSLALKMSVRDTLLVRGFFLLELDTSKQENKILSVKVEGYKVFRRDVLFCQELNRIDEKDCNAEIRSYLPHVIEGIKKRPELIEKDIIEREGLRFSKFYKIGIVPI